MASVLHTVRTLHTLHAFNTCACRSEDSDDEERFMLGLADRRKWVGGWAVERFAVGHWVRG